VSPKRGSLTTFIFRPASKEAHREPKFLNFYQTEWRYLTRNSLTQSREKLRRAKEEP